MSLPPAAGFPRPQTSRTAPIAPGTPERAELKARLAAMAGERIDIPIDHRRQGDPHRATLASVVMPHKHGHVLGHLAQGERRARPAGRRRPRRGAPRVGELAVGGSRRGLPARRGTAGHDVAPDAQRRDDARPVEDGVPGRDRRGVRADRLLALQRRVRAGAATASSRSARTASGTRSSTGRSRASSTRSRRSTSPRSAATCRPRRR